MACIFLKRCRQSRPEVRHIFLDWTCWWGKTSLGHRWLKYWFISQQSDTSLFSIRLLRIHLCEIWISIYQIQESTIKISTARPKTFLCISQYVKGNVHYELYNPVAWRLDVYDPWRTLLFFVIATLMARHCSAWAFYVLQKTAKDLCECHWRFVCCKEIYLKVP